ncbi:hypothetical protein GMDG_05773 [Pseudogymnoascus destructans 20631-21]|uniref:Uncharacterized protein n=1 Tax=Pseudogymnoascus destructans (strain ATCC MYA-4855 / 20631-21) TaxID=658429 RepID=L8FPK0_PSED2|nr:hypothetical protein GMDG_05773 [Pseudogymnoascus destructans 20631-21]
MSFDGLSPDSKGEKIDIEEGLTTAKASVEDLYKEVALQKGIIESHQLAVDTLEEEHAKFTTTIESHTKEQGSYMNTIKELEAKIAEAKSTIDSLHDENGESRRIAASRLSDYEVQNKELVELKEEIQRLPASNDSLTMEVADLGETIVSNKSTLGAHDWEITNVKKICNNLRDQNVIIQQESPNNRRL